MTEDVGTTQNASLGSTAKLLIGVGVSIFAFLGASMGASLFIAAAAGTWEQAVNGWPAGYDASDKIMRSSAHLLGFGIGTRSFCHSVIYWCSKK